MSWCEIANAHFWRREPQLAIEAAERASELAVAHALPVWRSEAKVMWAWARVVLGSEGAALRDLEQALAERVAVGPRGMTLVAAAHGEACLVLGEVERGISVIDEAVAFGEHSGEGAFLPELHRIKGQLLSTSDREAADASLTRAFELAQAASAKLFELRAAMGLERLWRSSERHGDAVSRLAATFDWFTEGFSGAELTEARQTLDAARGQPPAARRRLA
jgi:hypothetical protein